MCGSHDFSPPPPAPPTGSNRKRDHRNVRVKKPDYKVAYVQLVSVPGGGGGHGEPARAVTGSDLSGAGGRPCLCSSHCPGPRKALRGRISRSTALRSNPQRALRSWGSKHS